MKIRIDHRVLYAASDCDAERIKAMITSAIMIGGDGTHAVMLLIAAIGELADWSDVREAVLETAIRCLAESLSPDWQARVQELCDAVDREKDRTS